MTFPGTSRGRRGLLRFVSRWSTRGGLSAGSVMFLRLSSSGPSPASLLPSFRNVGSFGGSVPFSVGSSGPSVTFVWGMAGVLCPLLFL